MILTATVSLTIVATLKARPRLSLTGPMNFANSRMRLRDEMSLHMKRICEIIWPKNLNILESGLTLWPNSSVEYPLEGRRIDILAKDRDGIPVVIELKLSRGHERTLGKHCIAAGSSVGSLPCLASASLWWQAKFLKSYALRRRK